MDRKEYLLLVQRLEQYAKAHPKMYKAKVLGLMALGYGYLFFLLLALLGLTGGIIALLIVMRGQGIYLLIKLGIFLVPLLWAVTRALCVRLPAPQGLRLKPADAPPLFDALEKLRRRLDAPRMHRVLLVGDFNVSVCQHPLLGLLGWHRNYLLIGLPMLYALTPAQFESVLGHELGHISGAHGRMGNWIVRTRASWLRLVESLELKPLRGDSLVMGFFKWHAPRFYTWTSVLARENEYEADRTAAELAGADVFAGALVGIEVQAAFLRCKHYVEMDRRASAGEPPPESWYGEMGRRMRDGHAPAEVAEWLEAALRVKTDADDTHPCLRDRLAPLGVSRAHCETLGAMWARPTPLEESAAALLGGREPELRRQLDAAIREHVQNVWAEQREKACQMRQRLEELAARKAEEPLGAEEELERALLIVRTQGAEAGAVLLQACAARADAHPAAIYRYGSLLLEQGDEAGLQYVEQAIERDRTLTLPGCELAIGWLKSRGRDAESESWFARGNAHYALESQARQERWTFSPTEPLLPHELPQETVAQVCAALAEFKAVKRAYLVRKQVRLMPERPHYILALKIHFPMLSFQASNAYSKACDKVAERIELPFTFHVIPLHESYAKMEKRMKEIAGVCVYTR